MTGQAFQHTHRTLFICACKFAFTYEISIIYQLSAFDMCHDQKLDCIPILEDGHQFVNMDLYTHYSDSQYGMDDHKSYTMF